jgi:hypothetical protein
VYGETNRCNRTKAGMRRKNGHVRKDMAFVKLTEHRKLCGQEMGVMESCG